MPSEVAREVLAPPAMSEQSEALQSRTKRFALDVVGLLDFLPNSEPGRTIKRQLARSATSVAANYRASCRARSHAEFTARIALVAEEADETLFWLIFTVEAKMTTTPALTRLHREAAELTAIFSTSAATARRNSRASQSRRRSS
jgi:four helix bundle protein